jgi:type II secretory pathway pseudopilin PulG
MSLRRPARSRPRGRRHPCRSVWQSCFTLLEVIIAAGILALAVAMSVGTMGAARARILRAESRWGRQHLLSQAAEFFLLCGPEARYPEGLLPEGFSADCSLSLADDLPLDALDAQEGWVLGRFHIRVYDTSGSLMAECSVDKLLREEDCE